MRQLSKLFQIKQIKTSAYRPQSMGSIERHHIVLIEYLKHYITKHREWDELIKYSLFCYNTQTHEGTGFSPYELVFGNKPRFPSSIAPHEKLINNYDDYLVDLMDKLREIRKEAVENLKKAKYRSKEIYDRRINPQIFNVSDKVFLLRHNPSKFEDHYNGPFEIIEIIGNVNAKIQLTNNKTKVVHFNQLKHAHIAI
jgi:hypothetical protein